MSFRKTLAMAGVGLMLLTAYLWGDGGTHPKTTSKLLEAFEDLRKEDAKEGDESPAEDASATSSTTELAEATFGTGCFWCTEAVFEELKGVKSVVSGYSGGRVPNPTYQQVCTGATGHAEAVQITYDPREISYAKLLEVFWTTHDPTTLNRQGPDQGTQYRSAIFYHDDEQREIAEKYKKKLDESQAFRDPIVTEITAYTNFFVAENYHQDYFALNGRQPYCRMVIRPKMTKFRRVFRDDLKKD